MAPYTPENNPMIPGDPYSYDLKWMVDQIIGWKDPADSADRAKASEEAAALSAEAAAASAENADNSAMIAKNYADNIADPVSGLVTEWLDDHITQPTTPAIDTSLTIAGAAADSKAAGDAIKVVKDELKLTAQTELGTYIEDGWTTGKYIDTSTDPIDITNPLSNSNFAYIILSVTPQDRFKIDMAGTSAVAAWTFIDNQGNIITKATQQGYYNQIITAPAGSSMLVLNSRSASHRTVWIGVSDLAKKLSADKKIVMLGDSIIGNYDDSTGVAAQLSNEIGALCYNCAFGGSNMATDTTGSINPLLLPFRGFKVIEAITTGDYSEMESAVASDPDHETLLPYFQSHIDLLKNMNWSTVDIITLSYGTNDWGTSVRNADSGYDTDTFMGAYRTALEMLWNTYPNIKVMIAGPIWRGGTITAGELNWDSDNHTNTRNFYLIDYSNSAEKVADEYHVLFAQMYNGPGMNRYNWKQYFPSTGSSAIHPNAAGRYLVARRYAWYINTL